MQDSARSTQVSSSERGIALIEVLIAIVIFSLGVLGVTGMQAVAIRQSADAKYRADAAYYANRIIGTMWADTRTNLGNYAHHTGGSACNFTGADSSLAEVTSWQSSLAGKLPGVTNKSAQILVDAGTNRVTVRICWTTPDNADHVFETLAQVNG